MPDPIVTPTPSSTPPGKTPAEKLAEILAAGGKSNTTSGAGATGSVNKDKETNVIWRSTTAGNVKEYKTVTQAKNYLTINSPEYSLVKSNWQALKNTDLKSRTVTSFWKKVVDIASANNSSPWDVMNAYLNGGSLDGAGTTTTGSGSGKYTPQVSITLLDRATSDSVIDSAILSTYGRKATDSERATFFNEYNKAAKAGTVTKTVKKGGKLVTTTTKNFDDKTFQQKYVSGLLDAALAQDSGADLSGEAGKLQDQLRQYSGDMGINMSDSQINSYVRQVYNKETTADDVVNKLREQAMVLYQPYADSLKADSSLTVRKLASPYTSLMAGLYEQTDDTSISLNDPLIQKFISNKYSLADATKEIKQTARYRNTAGAAKDASNLGSALATAMGF